MYAFAAEHAIIKRKRGIEMQETKKPKEPLLSVKNDFVFKLIFGDARHKDILRAFLNAITKISLEDLEELEIIDSELRREYQSDKKGILDIRVKLKDGKQCDIEIQVVPLEIMPERSMFYVSKMLTGQIEKGKNYTDLKKCIAVNIVDFPCVELEQIHTVFHYREDTHPEYQLSDMCEIHFLQLPYLKNKKCIEETDEAIIKWLMFINHPSPEILETLAKEGKEMAKAVELLEVISQDEQNRRIYEARQKEIMDEAQRQYESRKKGLEQGLKKGLEQGIKQGIQQGMQQGMQQAKLEMVESLLDILDDDVIAEKTGIPLSKVEELRAKQVK